LSVAMGSGLAAIAAIVVLPRGTISVNEGYDVLINAMAVCIIGGLGSNVGAIVAAFIIGYAQMFTDSFAGPHWKMIVSLVAILVILVVKPSGLFGKQKELEERI
jgi:branched-chain amino acid transport system permease protein